MPLDTSIRKVMVIGSGPIVIGQAAEFDYAGTQACRVLKDAGLEVVLVNSNPATIMTDAAMADEVYLEPLTVESVKRIIEKERPDSLLAGLGGQTGLTLAMQLSKDGFLDAMGVRLLGTNAEAIDKAEDRELFRDTMLKIGQKVVPSDIANDLPRAKEIAGEIGYPVIIRPAFTLGGAGGGVAYTEEELLQIAQNGLMLSPITQVLVEKFIAGWKEIEFEVMRDAAGNAIAICSMENVDPVGIHTGDSIVVAPALTLSKREYGMLRQASLDIIEELGIQGGCNCQFALDPESFDYAVIEVNPRVSRSSALASKATGYPIAKVTAKIALGYTLDEIKNDVTGKTCACFEPAVDYVVCKLPKWPFDKFVGAERTLGTQMKATGEVMSIAPSFEMALMKAVRGAENGMDTLHLKNPVAGDIRARLHEADDRRLFTVFEALCMGLDVEEIHAITKIDRFFLSKLKNLAALEAELAEAAQLTEELYLRAKKCGYPDAAIARISGKPLPTTVAPVYKMVDTCAAEFAAETPYFYSTYDRHCEALALPKSGKKRIIVLGSGPIRIGQGIEFDYSSVHCVWTLKKLGYEVIIINNNPETVSTDFDTADRLYFEPLTREDVLHIIALEQPEGVVVAFGGQTAINLTQTLTAAGVAILGTSAESIDLAEDRGRFDALLEQFSMRRPRGLTALTEADALRAAQELGYPVLLRPSYVIGGQNMTIAHNDAQVSRYMELILAQGIENPVLVDQYLMGTELEVDVISDGEDVLIPGIMQHIERAGVHSGDSIAVYPPFSIGDKMLGEILEASRKLTLAMRTKGLVNIQFLIYEGELYVIEVNPRASRTIPYISKVTGVPMVDLATRVMVGAKLKDLGCGTGLYKQPPYVAVKVPVFSFEKLRGVNATLSPEMKSTGEVLGVGTTLAEAMYKGLLSAGYKLMPPDPRDPAGVLISVNKRDHLEVMDIARRFYELGFRLYATDGTAAEISRFGVDVEIVGKLGRDNRVFELLERGSIDYIIITGSTEQDYLDDFIRLNRRALQLGIPALTSLDTARALVDILESRYSHWNTELVNICDLRTSRKRLEFTKMQGTGNDYIIFEDFDGSLTCPEALAIRFCHRHSGIGGDGLVLIERSEVADAKMRMFNADGSEGRMAGNVMRSVAKYLHDRGIVPKMEISIETVSGVKQVLLYAFGGVVRSARVSMGAARLTPKEIPVLLDGERVIDRRVRVADGEYNISCVNMGNPHCVVFVDRVDDVDVERIGPMFENDPLFPERVNTEFVRVVNRNTLKMRVWERGSGETMACGTGACAAVVAAIERGLCDRDADITVKVRGGELIVSCIGEEIYLTGETETVYSGVVEY